MCYLYYILALGIGLVFPAFMATSNLGLSIAVFWDLVSLLIVVGASYFLVASSSGTLSFYRSDTYLKMWGDMALKMGYIGTMLGLILILGGMGTPYEGDIDPYAKLASSLAIAIITILYGLVFKFMIIEPYLGCRRQSENK